MPRRTQEFRGFSGFDAPAPNPFIRMPDGRRMLTSDINDARMSLDFGGDSGGTRGAPVMPVTEGVRQPSRGLTGDNSNAGLVNRTLFDNQANTDWWSTGDANETITASAGGTRTLDPGISAGLQGVSLFGEPTVETPTSDARYTFDYDTAPSLFPDQNEWWRDGALAQGASTSNKGGGIWEGSESISDFGGDLALGNDLNASLKSLQFGEDYPAIEVPERPFDALAEGTGIPVEPDVLDQEYEWTTSPDDRRFLAGPPEEETPQNVAGTISVGGTSLSNFGGNMSLGAFLNTPLASMRFGEGYPNTVQSADEIRVGATAPNSSTGRMGRWNGQEWEDAGPIQNDGTGTTIIPRDNPNVATGNDGTGTTIIPIQGGGTLEGFRIIGHDTINGQPIYEDAQGNRFVNPGTGTPISAGVRDAMARGDYESAYGPSAMSQQASRDMLMANWGGIQQSALRMSASDEGRTWFGSPERGTGFIDPETGRVTRRGSGSRGLANISNSNRGIGGRG